MGQQVRFFPNQPHSWVAGQKTVQNITRGMLLREVAIRLTGQLTCTAVNNTAANTKRGDEWGVVQRIDVIINGNDVIRSFSGNELWWLNRFMYGNAPRVTSVLGDATTLNPAFDSTLIIPFWQPLANRALDTILDTRTVSDIRIEVTWGTFTDINGSATGFTVAPTLGVNPLMSWGVDVKPSACRMSKMLKQIAAANQQEIIPLAVGPLYRGFLLNTANAGGTADVASSASTGITNIKLVSGANVFRDVSFNMLRDYQLQRTNASRAYAANGYIEPRRGNTNNLQDSWVFLDLVSDGFLGECVDSAGLTELNLEVTAAAACQLTVIPIQIIPPKAPASAVAASVLRGA